MKAEQKRIFHIAYYEGLLKTRTALLEESGYAVSSALGNEEARAAGQELLAKTDLVLIGFSGTLEQRAAMIRWVKENAANVPVLALQSHLSGSSTGADAVAVADYPEIWLAVVASMLRSGKRTYSDEHRRRL